MDPTLRTIRRRFKSAWELAGPVLLQVGICFLVAVVPAYSIRVGISDVAESALLDAWFWVRGTREIPKSVSIVRLDNPAYRKSGLGPGELFPRQYMAEGIEKIAAAGAKLIIIDGVPQRPGDDPEADQKLAQALENTPTVIARSSETVTDIDPEGNQKQRKEYNKPIELFEKSAKMVVQTMARLTNGVVREICLSNDRDMFSKDRVPMLAPLRRFVSPDLVEPGGFDFINFYGPPPSVVSLSFAELIGPYNALNNAYFKDRVVLIGAHTDSGAGIDQGKDSFMTSVSSESMFGVEIHATIVANLLDRSWIKRLPTKTDSLMQAFLAICLSLLVLRLGMFAAVTLTFSFIGIWLGASYYAFVALNRFLPGVILCGVVLSVLVIRWALVAFAARKRA